MQLDVFQFEHLDAFFAAAIKQLEHRKNWSLGRWAQQLGLAQTASLTRVLNGQRAPGEGLVSRLVDYFELDAAQAEYFRHLVVLRKASNAQSRGAIEARMHELRRARTVPSAALHVTRGHLLEIAFSAEPDPLDALLAPDGVSCARSKGYATLTLQLASYKGSSFGAGQELVLSVAAKPGALPYACDITGSSAAFGSYHRLLWGNPWRLGHFDLRIEGRRVSCAVTVAEQPWARVEVDLASASPCEEERASDGLCRAGASVDRYRLLRRLRGVTTPFAKGTHVGTFLGAAPMLKWMQAAHATPTSVTLWDDVAIEAFAPRGSA